MMSKVNLKNSAGFDDYHRSFDQGVESVNRAYSKLNPDQYYYNLRIQNYWIGAPRVLDQPARFEKEIKKKEKKEKRDKKK
jgi:hypothetical protein